MQEKSMYWVTIVSEMHAIRQQLERINTGDIIERASVKCMEVGITLNYEDPLQALRSNELFDPKLFRQELKEKSIDKIIDRFDRRFSTGNIELLSSLDSLDSSKKVYQYFDE